MSDSLPILVALAALTGLALLWVRRSAARPPVHRVTVAELPRVVDALSRSGGEGDFAGFVAPGVVAGASLSVQFSIEQGRPGLDWILLQPGNIDGRAHFERLAAARGHAVATREMNDVPYLRVEEGDVAALGAAVLDELCGLRPEDSVQMVVEGLAWPPESEGERRRE